MRSAAPSIPAAEAGRRVWLSVGTLLDGLSTPVLAGAHIVYTSETILYAGAASPPRDLVQPGHSLPDAVLPGHTLLPGLVDAHAHLVLAGGELDPARRAAHLTRGHDLLLSEARGRLEPLLRLGIIAVRDAGDRNGIGTQLSRLALRADRPLMPHVDSPGAALHHAGRYGGFMARPIEEFPSPGACAIARIACGADRIKIIATGGVNVREGRVTGPPQMTAEEIAGIVTIARISGRQTFAHASGEAGIGHAVHGGVDSVEHGYFVTDEQLSHMADRRIAWVPTCVPLLKQIEHAERLGWDGTTVSGIRRILDRHAASILKAEQLGVTVMAGSDGGAYGVLHGFGLLEELEWMEQAGRSPLAVIRSATGLSSDRLAFREPVGQIRAGCRSRFILTPHSPLATVAHLRRDKVIIYDGVPLDAPAPVPQEGL